MIEVVAVQSGGGSASKLRAGDLRVALDGVDHALKSARYLPRRAPTTIVVVDEPNISAVAGKRARDAVAQLIEGTFGDRAPTQVGITRWPEQRLRLTRDRTVLTAESVRVRGRAEEPSELLPADVRLDVCTTDSCRRALAELGSQYARDVTLITQAITVRKALWAHGQNSLEALRSLTDALRSTPGPKTIYWFTSGLLIDSRSPVLEELSDSVATARVSIYPVRVAAGDWLQAYYEATGLDSFMRTAPDAPGEGPGSPSVASGLAGLSLVAAVSGGAVFTLGADTTDAVARLLRQSGGSYALEVDVPERAMTTRTMRLRVGVTVPGVRVLTRARWDPGADVADLLPAAAPASVGTRSPDDPELRQVLTTAARYVAHFEREFSSVVAEERLDQIARIRDVAGYTYVKRRSTRADLLLVQNPGGEGWVPFRDVYEVDGEPVRDRDGRLRRLFLERPATAAAQAEAITAESARFNIGSIRRNFNVPTFTLLFLKTSNASRFSFKKKGEEVRGGISAWKLEFAERARPTLIRGVRGNDVPVSGVLWIDPRTGAVVATRLEVFELKLKVNAEVAYVAGTIPGLWVPSEMSESYLSTDDGQSVQTLASYSNFRRFTVKTSEILK